MADEIRLTFPIKTPKQRKKFLSMLNKCMIQPLEIEIITIEKNDRK